MNTSQSLALKHLIDQSKERILQIDYRKKNALKHLQHRVDHILKRKHEGSANHSRGHKIVLHSHFDWPFNPFNFLF